MELVSPLIKFDSLQHIVRRPIATLILSHLTVIGGQRAVLYNRISGVQMDVKEEGMHFKVL